MAAGFSASWLALREPADERARNVEIGAACAAYFANRASIDCIDLGCGSGSNLRALAALLPAQQNWRLVDHDAALLTAARAAIIAWAEVTLADDDALIIEKDGKQITIRFVEADLARADFAALGPAPDLITAAALFDLVSARWIESFVNYAAQHKLPVLAALNYDGRTHWDPKHPSDKAILDAFHQHQGSNKGFGPAAGPRAHAILARSLTQHGYNVKEGDSAWHLELPQDDSLMAELIDGITQAAVETEWVTATDAKLWRSKPRSRVTIGHGDLFAIPR